MSKPTEKFWLSGTPEHCDVCGLPIVDTFIDGATRFGPWGCVCPTCHGLDGRGLGIGRGQKYVKTVGGRWRQVEGGAR